MPAILVIDDNSELLEIERLLLSQAGHQVTAVNNGPEGLRLAREGRFDLVVTDLVMPETDGLEIIMALRRTDPAVRMLAMSGGDSASPADCLVFADKLGAGTLTKPFSRMELLDAVNRALAK